MTSRQDEPRRTASESVSLPALTAQAPTALQAAGLEFNGLELNAGFRRKARDDHFWYVADAGVGRNGQPWLMVTAGNAKVTGDVSTPLVVYKSWETAGVTINPAESADSQRQIDQTARRRRGEDKARRDTAANVRALFQDDLKKRLALSTISQVSSIALGVALFGPVGTVGGLVHLVHQGIMKITLFFRAGNYEDDLEALGGAPLGTRVARVLSSIARRARRSPGA